MWLSQGFSRISQTPTIAYKRRDVPSEGKGQRFESSRARQILPGLVLSGSGLIRSSRVEAIFHEGSHAEGSRVEAQRSVPHAVSRQKAGPAAGKNRACARPRDRAGG